MSNEIFVKLPENCTLYTISDIKHLISQHMTDNVSHPLNIDLKNVRECDESLLQLLISAYNTCTEKKLIFRLHNEPDIFQDLCRRLGLSSLDLFPAIE